MTKKILELSLSLFVIVCVAALILGVFSLRPFYYSGLKLIENSQAVLQDSQDLIRELREGISETQNTSTELVKMIESSALLFKEMTQAIEETKDTPKELVKLLQEIRLLAEKIKETVSEAKQAQSDYTLSVNNTRDVLYELAMASFILSLSEEDIIPAAEADQMILQSIETIEGRSERFGKLAKSIIEYRRSKR
jgi:peptidoglycan hydrolase CwlO-like protein